MKTDLIRTLYKEFFRDDGGDPWWYRQYSDIVGRVVEWRNAHADDGTGFSVERDEGLLKSLIYDDHGVSDYGLSILSLENYNGLIRDRDFLDALSGYVRDVSRANFDTLKSAMVRYFGNGEVRGGMPWLRLYRLASACNLGLTTVVNDAKFHEIFWTLVNRGIIDAPSGEDVNDWYSRNVYLADKLKEALQPGDAMDVDGVAVDDYKRNMFVWFLYEYYHSPFDQKRQVVKYGPPGTGKTFTAKKEAESMFCLWKAEHGADGFSFRDCFEQMQFHPSFSYEDFIEGLRPSQDEGRTGGVVLKLKNGLFKDICKKAGRWEIDLYGCSGYEDKDICGLKVSDIEPETRAKLIKKDYWKYVFDEKNEDSTLADVLPPYIVLIDEINRAELSRVFGELMYCLEYRGVRGAVRTQYAELNTQDEAMLWETVGKDEEGNVLHRARFFVPTNVRIVGTMNTIDRSVESFDFALRRRFAWELVEPNPSVLSRDLEISGWRRWERILDGWVKLNEAISRDLTLLGPDYRIGHAYLMNMHYDRRSSLTDLRNSIWNDAVRPLLEEYLRGSLEKGKDDPLKPFRDAFYC